MTVLVTEEVEARMFLRLRKHMQNCAHCIPEIIFKKNNHTGGVNEKTLVIITGHNFEEKILKF